MVQRPALTGRKQPTESPFSVTQARPSGAGVGFDQDAWNDILRQISELNTKARSQATLSEETPQQGVIGAGSAPPQAPISTLLSSPPSQISPTIPGIKGEARTTPQKGALTDMMSKPEIGKFLAKTARNMAFAGPIAPFVAAHSIGGLIARKAAIDRASKGLGQSKGFAGFGGGFAGPGFGPAKY